MIKLQILKKKKATILVNKYNVIETDTTMYYLLVLNVVLFPQNTGLKTLPKNTYIHGSMLTKDGDPQQDYFNTHVYKLSRDHNKESFILIELSTCLGKIDFAIGEMTGGQFKMVSKHNAKTSEQYGKTLIELTMDEKDADAYIKIEGKNATKIESEYNYLAYAIRYNSYTNDTAYPKYILDNKAIVTESLKDDIFELKWGSVSVQTIEKEETTEGPKEVTKEVLARSKFIIKLIPANGFDANYDAVCYNHKVSWYYKTAYNPSKGSDSYKVNSDVLVPNLNYFVSIVAQTDENNDHTLLAYTPFQIRYDKVEEDAKSFWFIFLLCWISFILCLCLIVVYRKYKTTKQRLDYEVNDIRNLASLPKSDSEMRSVSNDRSKEKYTNLNDNSERTI